MDEPKIPGGDMARLWTAAQTLAFQAASVRGHPASRVPSLLLFTDPDRTPRPWEIAVRMPRGSGVVYRAFGAADAHKTALRLRDVTYARGMALLIGLDADLAEAIGADGLHLPERALSAAYALSGRRPDWILTGAAHSSEVACSAHALDAVVLSPVFPAGGASTSRPPLGVCAVAQVARRRPVIALGGITADNVGDLIGSGAAGIAAVAGLTKAAGD